MVLLDLPDRRSESGKHLDADTDGEILERRIDPMHASLPVVVDPVVAVPATSPVADLEEPGEDVSRSGVDRDRAGGRGGPRAQELVAGHRTPDLLV